MVWDAADFLVLYFLYENILNIISENFPDFFLLFEKYSVKITRKSAGLSSIDKKK